LVSVCWVPSARLRSEAASKVLQGTNLSIYGENGMLIGQLAPVFEILARAVQQATQGDTRRAREGNEPA
jgi:hypothetical protein